MWLNRKHHRLRAVEQHAVVEMVAQRPRQHPPFDVAAFADEIVGRVAVADALDVLFDDRSLVEHLRHVMGRRADQLDAALEGLVIGLGALEAGQNEWWMLMQRPASFAVNPSDRTCM